MKKNFYLFALITAVLFSAHTAYADVKIKTRQSMSGQTYESATYIKGKRQRTEQNMGSVKTVNLTQCDLRRYVQMNPDTKTYLINQFNAAVADASNSQKTSKTAANPNDKVVRAGGTITTTVTTKDTGERKQIFGFPARHLIITMESVSSPDACSPYNSKMQMDGWYIDAEFVLDCDQNYSYGNYSAGKNGGCQDKHQYKQIGAAKRGYPVYEKMTMFDQSGKESFSTVSEVVELSKATLDAALFEVPADYREVSDAAQMYNVAQNDDSTDTPKSGANAVNSTMKLPAQSAANNNAKPSTLAAKQPGTVRIGVSVKTGAVGEGVAAADLAAAVQNTFGEMMKGTKIEVVPLEAKLAALVDGEAAKKECDFILYASVSHKKGGGGFGGMFGKIAPVLGSVAPVAGMSGNVAGAVAGHVASTAIISASQVSSNVKSKDEITLDIKLNQTGGIGVLAKQFKNKAKSDGEDIISPLIEQAAEVVVATTRK